MKARVIGAYVRVSISPLDVAAFKAIYPCSGLGRRGFTVEFDRRSGDLVSCSAPNTWDGSGLLALVNDAQTYAHETDTLWPIVVFEVRPYQLDARRT